ncbi:molybdopterin-guanine dinucleotide biosynthesis protein B [Bacillus aerolatus]|uniref:Molybdopterin-guanine dinucleotide biosynthesis protein B n=1 Tax=Bacillus aerolatus TaxID=2653354 RepID=A0A6I1FKE4_9BACI|nr:molybdopterin-guanine dinucleotide biosynthesis protein B [Bacillus aerolatus]KAB7709189.1 molybdopterin-guanine dinucleotide biosynthesis protein B [Bacillus aerolatus]
MAVGLNKPVLQVAGYQNSGKTTLMTKFIQEAKRQDWTVASFKHHGHGGAPLIAEDKKDSGRHFQAGALVAGVEGGGVLQITAEKAEWQLEEILCLYDNFPVDLLLIEGYKQADYPKVVLVKDDKELELLDRLKNIQAVISWQPLIMKKKSYPVFLLEEEEKYLDWFVQYIGKKLGSLK